MKIFRQLPGMMVMAFSSAFLFAGCTKNSVGNNTPQNPQTYINVMHMAPWAPAAQVYLNDKLSSSAFNPLNYSTIYSPVDAGVYSISFKKASSDSVLASLTSDLYDSAHYYTVFIYNSSPTQVKAGRVEDQYLSPSATQFHFRFWHLGPDAPTVDVYLDSVKVASFRHYTDNLASTNFNGFQDFNPGYHTVYAKVAGTDSLIAQSSGADFLAGNYYTFFLNGLSSGTVGTQLNIGILRAAQ